MPRTAFVVSAVVALVALLTSTAAYAVFMGGGPSPDPFVVGGGGFGPGTTTTGQVFGVARDFSVDSHVEKKGLKTYGILRYGNNLNSAVGGFLVDVSCVNIQGNRASVGGTVHGSDPPQGWVMFFVDTGGPTGPKDQASPAQLEYLDPTLQAEGFPGWPAGFPNTGACPSPTEGPGATAYGTGFLDLDRGDVIVSAGSS